MKRRELIIIILLSIVVNTIGFLLDSDLKNSSIWTTILEYFMMLGLTFILFSIIYGVIAFVIKKIIGVKNQA
jgi:hypothetical protein